MRCVVFLNSLALGGTEKAACLWSRYLTHRGHAVKALSLTHGPRRFDFERSCIPLALFNQPTNSRAIADALADVDVIHAHAPGFPHQGDILGLALNLLPRRVPVVQTNIFGQLRNPPENAWTDFRLFISWTSCVQAARRAGKKLNLDFFRRQSVAVYPVTNPFAQTLNTECFLPREQLASEADALRKSLGFCSDTLLFGRFSRPEPNKWTPLVLKAFLAAYKINPQIRLLLREPPPAVVSELVSQKLAAWAHPSQLSHMTPCGVPVILLRATADPMELAVSQMACDAILHTSSIGESFGYGLAEPMALGKPVITNSVPWHDQAQIELVRHGQCGLVASTVQSMKRAILHMAQNRELLIQFGESAQKHILALADPQESTERLLVAMQCAIEGRDNPHAELDLETAIKTAEYLDRHQWGHSTDEMLWLRVNDAKVRFLKWQRLVRNRCILPRSGGSGL